MKNETKVALQESIEHWERLRDGTHEKNEHPYASQCSLCLRFDCGVCVIFDKDLEEVERCPVYKKTGKDTCEETPYNKAYEAFFNERLNKGERYNRMNAEVQFLKSLLPKE